MEGNNNNNSPFYNHSNNSTSSNLKYRQSSNTTSTSQVSSVGFNNLKKLNTNSSQISTASSGTIKTNPLTKLFTKNRSLSNVTQSSYQYNDDVGNIYNSDEDDMSTFISVDQKKASSGKFKLAKKNKIKFSSKSTANKPELSIQTGGHHGLRVPKKILSSTSLEEATISSRKNSVSSPASTFHNLFHRSYSSSQITPDNISSGSLKEESLSQQRIGTNPNRTTVSLSSNNSNSFITDTNFARIYNFTNPAYSVEDYETSGEHTSFLDIHKKLMVPTDQYLQNKLHKNQAQEIGLGIMSENEIENDYINKYLIDFGKRSARFFGTLLIITRPLFMPSQQKRLANGSTHLYLGIALEDIANYIKDNYLDESLNLAINEQGHVYDRASSIKTLKLKTKSTKSFIAGSSSFFSIDENTNDNFDDFKIREISQDLLSFFTRCMVIFHKDFPNYEMKHSDFSSKKTKFNITSPQAATLIREWERLSSMWLYFNQKIRYYLLGIFHPLQKYFHNISVQNFSNSLDIVEPIEIENILLLAYRDIIVIPLLMQRKRDYERFSIIEVFSSPKKMQEKPSSSPHSSNEIQLKPAGEMQSITLEEESALKADDSKLLKGLISCFGVILSQIHSEPGNADGEQYLRDEIFLETFTWLSSIQ